MFSVQQKRDISDAVQKILRATSHPELPTTGEVSFKLHVDGAETWSFADIQNNGAVGNPGLNPHNELMDSLPEEEARSLIEKAKDLPLPDPRATPEEFYKEVLTTTLAKMQREMTRLTDRDRIKDQLYSEVSDALGKFSAFLTPLMEDNLIQHHSEKLIRHSDQILDIQAALGATSDSDANALLSLPDRLDNLETAIRQLGNQSKDK